MVRTFFPEVQALRALAVVLVVAFHLQPRLLSGGFIGVDVFFVISGYLITGHLLRQYEQHGRLDLAGFWAARARRILPAGILCIVVTVAAATAIYPFTQWTAIGTQGVAAALSVLNWLLAAESVDYLASANDPSPLQHFWSLGVEEQFYVFWPFVVLAGCTIALRSRRRGARAAPAMLFGVVIAAGFALSSIQVFAGDAAAFFATTTRVWELAVGGALALIVPRLSLAGPARTVLSLTGVVVILAGAALIDRGDPFPGAFALVPVLGAAAVIAGGATTGRFAPAPLYSWRPIQWLGDASYSLYLWHFPPIVFATVLLGRAPGWLAGTVLAAAALAAAAVSHRFVERPARESGWLRATPRRSLAFGATAIAVGCVVAGVLPVSAQRAETEWVSTAQALAAGGVQGAAAMAPDEHAAAVAGTGGMTPSPTRATKDVPAVVPRSCMATPQAKTTPTCEGGDLDGDIRVALVGDSHAQQLTTAIFAIGMERGWHVTTYLHASCPFSTETRLLEKRGGAVCAAPNAQTLGMLLEDPPQIVVAANWASDDFAEADTGHAPGVAGYAEVWNALADAGSQVIAFTDVPRPHLDPTAVDCVARAYDSPQVCAVPRAEALVGRNIVAKAHALAPRTAVIDLTDRFCSTTTCPAVIGNVLVYRDTNHVTDTFMRTLTPYIASAITDAMPRRDPAPTR